MTAINVSVAICQLATCKVSSFGKSLRCLRAFIVEGRSAAKNYDCKFIEVSAAIDHKVDDLLVGILKQIRLIKERNESAAKGKHKHRPKLRPRPDETCCLHRAKQNVLGRLLRYGKYASRSCDNLYVL